VLIIETMFSLELLSVVFSSSHFGCTYNEHQNKDGEMTTDEAAYSGFEWWFALMMVGLKMPAEAAVVPLLLRGDDCVVGMTKRSYFARISFTVTPVD